MLNYVCVCVCSRINAQYQGKLHRNFCVHSCAYLNDTYACQIALCVNSYFLMNNNSHFFMNKTQPYTHTYSTNAQDILYVQTQNLILTCQRYSNAIPVLSLAFFVTVPFPSRISMMARHAAILLSARLMRPLLYRILIFGCRVAVVSFCARVGRRGDCREMLPRLALCDVCLLCVSVCFQGLVRLHACMHVCECVYACMHVCVF
jgi:hypothetical protein